MNRITLLALCACGSTRAPTRPLTNAPAPPQGGACPAGTPLAELTAPCTLAGHVDASTCFHVTGASPTWTVQYGACGHEDRSTDIDLSLSTSGIGSDLPMAWLAELIVGRARVHCIPATASCPAPSNAAYRAHEFIDYEGPRPLRWMPGSPVAPEREIVIISGGDPIMRLFSDEPALFVLNPAAPAIDHAGPLAKTATCGALELWTSPEATAVRDPKLHRWAYVYITDDPAPTVYRTHVIATSCTPTHVKIELAPPEAGTPNVIIAVDLQTGDATNSARP